MFGSGFCSGIGCGVAEVGRVIARVEWLCWRIFVVQLWLHYGRAYCFGWPLFLFSLNLFCRLIDVDETSALLFLSNIYSGKRFSCFLPVSSSDRRVGKVQYS